jgi:predicted nuclease of restriction endonuclease-like (RecB) superfamily
MSRSRERRSVVVNGDSSRHLIDPTKHTDAGRGHLSTPTRSTSGLLFRGHQPDTWAVLEHQIMSGLHDRVGRAPSNFERSLPANESELVQQITKDPYNLSFLTLERDAAERTVEAALVAHLRQFLLELGHGFAFVGRQYRLDIDGDELFIDLLKFHIASLWHVVIELKTAKLTAGDVGQLNVYVAAVDDILRGPGHNETVGLLLCTAKNERIVRYALGDSTSPMAVSGATSTPTDPMT